MDPTNHYVHICHLMGPMEMLVLNKPPMIAQRTDLQTMQEQTLGSFILRAADCNTQVREMPGHVGGMTRTSDRPIDQDRVDSLMHVLAHLGLKVTSSYVN